MTRRLEGGVSQARCSGGRSSILHQRERPHRVSDHRGRSCRQGLPSPCPCPAQIRSQQVTSPTPTWRSTPLQGGRAWPRCPVQAAAWGWRQGQTEGTGTWAQQGLWGQAGRAGMGCETQGTGGRIPGVPDDLRVGLRIRGRVSISFLLYLGAFATAASQGARGSPGKADPAGLAPTSPPAARQKSQRWDQRADGREHRPHPAGCQQHALSSWETNQGPQSG